MNHVILWLTMCIILLVVEGLSINLITIWFALGAGAAFFLALFHLPFIWQLAAFAIVSIITLLLTRPLVVRMLKQKPSEKTNVDAYIGKEAIVVEPIDNLRGKGLIRIAGVTWTAVSDDGQDIPADARVVVVSVKGVKAFVKLADQNKNG